jgi:HAD superfamily hydrolase (TIGR01509 family)
MTDIVIFDLDGTLVDTPRAITAAFTSVFGSMSLSAPPAAEIRATIGMPLEQAFGKLLGVAADDDQVADAVRLYQVQFREVIVPGAAGLLFPGVADGLAALSREGFVLALATSKYAASAQAMLDTAGIAGYFTVVVGADQVSSPKPDPEMARMIMRRLAAAAGQPIVVGDTTHDLLMASSAGLRSVAVSYGVQGQDELRQAGPTWMADSFAEVMAHIRAAAAARRSAVVEELLDDRRYHIEFNGHLTNHVKHAVIALAGLGASRERVRSYYENYARLTPYGFPLEPPRSPRGEITDAGWRRDLGKRVSFSAYCEFFDREQAELGTGELLRRFAPELIPGWAGAFTHATIHLGWALDVSHRWMMIEGLAYLAFSQVSCHPERACPPAGRDDAGGPGGESPADSLLRMVRAWEDDTAGLRTSVEALVTDTEAGLAAGLHPELARSGLQYRNAMVLGAGHPLIYQLPGWALGQDPAASWEQLYYAATLLYLAVPGDFVLLHLITALHGLEQISARLPEDQRRTAVVSFWIGVLCILFSERNVPASQALADLDARYRNAADEGEPDGPQSWAATVARAVAEDEEHNPKLAYVLRRQWHRSGRRSVYRAAAARFTTTPELPPSFEEPPTE